MKKLLLAILLVIMVIPATANAQDYYRWRYPDLYPQYPYPYYVAPPPVYAVPPPPPVYYAPPPQIDPGLAMFNYWAGVVIRGLNCGPRFVGYDRWGRPVYRPVC